MKAQPNKTTTPKPTNAMFKYEELETILLYYLSTLTCKVIPCGITWSFFPFLIKDRTNYEVFYSVVFVICNTIHIYKVVIHIYGLLLIQQVFHSL